MNNRIYFLAAMMAFTLSAFAHAKTPVDHVADDEEIVIQIKSFKAGKYSLLEGNYYLRVGESVLLKDSNKGCPCLYLAEDSATFHVAPDVSFEITQADTESADVIVKGAELNAYFVSQGFDVTKEDDSKLELLMKEDAGDLLSYDDNLELVEVPLANLENATVSNPLEVAMNNNKSDKEIHAVVRIFKRKTTPAEATTWWEILMKMW